MDNKMSGWREACHDGMTKMNIYYLYNNKFAYRVYRFYMISAKSEVNVQLKYNLICVF